MPTLTGGIGAADLERFYARFFRNPPSLRLTLLSRTVGADRVVDELHLRFKHTEPMPWMLPGVPPTGKRVEVVVVSIVAVRGGKLCHEHVYWDQASVLLQIGLLEPKLGPVTARKTGVEMLPVVGREAARRALEGIDDEEAPGEADNDLIRRSANGHRAQSDDEEEEEGEQDGSYGDDSSKAASVSASASQKGDEKKKKALQPSQNGTNRANGMHGANGAAGYDEEAHKENGAGSPESDDVGKPAADSKGKSVAHRPRSSGPPKQKQQTSNPMKATNQADNTAKETASTT
ncbi:hypothetical protein VTK73DRAFT_9746 [Phialemonium thermophilum]|uniref:Carboxymethylenebutenolidase n=1 Tax=Phialemonium thermophilum TaxID=223376 RepID=A0ABR3W0R9_9PEZI